MGVPLSQSENFVERSGSDWQHTTCNVQSLEFAKEVEEGRARLQSLRTEAVHRTPQPPPDWV